MSDLQRPPLLSSSDSLVRSLIAIDIPAALALPQARPPWYVLQ